MSHYNQLTTIERGRIESFIQLGLSFHEIATRLNRSVSCRAARYSGGQYSK